MKNLYFLFLLVIGTTFLGKAQTANQYFFKAKTGVAPEDMTGAATLIGTNADGKNSGSTVFFPFSFAGNSYSSFSVSEDGVIILGDASYYPYPYDNYFTQTPAIFGQSAAYPVLLPWGEDLFTASNGKISYKITGTAPNRKLVIEYKVNSAEDNSSYFNKTFQVWLFEISNQIQFVYGDVASDWYNQANIGIAASASDFLSVNGADNTVSATSVASNSSVDNVSPATTPTKGTSYIFSPSPITETNPAPGPPVTNPITASVSVFPQYTVPGQQKHTIYLGYGLQSVALIAYATGGNTTSGYTYSWSPATGLSNAAVAIPVASPQVTTTYTVTISDGNGNTTTQQVTVYVMDVRCDAKGSKIKVCKHEKDKNKEECVAVKDVDDNLKKGATLGRCSTAAATTNLSMASINSASAALTEMNEAATGNVTVYPSPSNGVFNVQLPEASQQTTILVYDTGGRIVAQKATSENQRLVQFNLINYPRGVYLIKIVSKEEVKTSKIIIQ